MLRDYQSHAVNLIRESYKSGNRAPLFVLATGGGKCLAAGTKVLMFDGSVKNVENIIEGELLMGPDSCSRTVVSTCKGTEDLYTITPVKGEPFTVNESHILSFVITEMGNNKTASCAGISYRSGDIANVTVLDYINSSQTFKHVAKIWRTGVEFQNNNELPLDPYFLGLWLGDGSHDKPSICINNKDVETKLFLVQFARKNNLKVRVEWNSENSENYHLIDVNHGGRSGSTMRNIFKQLKVHKNKHIPCCYLTSSRENRLKLLAGLIDTDGSLAHNNYDYISVSEKLADDIVFLCRSLGLAAYKSKCQKGIKSLNFIGTYYRISISGETNIIPVQVERKKSKSRLQIKSVLKTGVKSIENIGNGNYYGFEISGNDRLFLLGDFTVTHNTVVFCHIAQTTAQRNKRVMILVHRVELLRQTSKKLTENGVRHGLINPKFTPDFQASVQVASVQTVVNRLDKIPAPDLIIIDEAHHATAGSWKKIIDAFPNALILGVTATPCRSDGTGLNGIFDDIILGPQTRELIEMGFLVKPIVYAPSKKVDLKNVKLTRGDYDKEQIAELIDKPRITGDAVSHYMRIADGMPAVVFCISVMHAQHVAEEFRSRGYKAFSVDGAMDDDTRERLLSGLGNGQVDIITSCDLISEGTDIPAIGCAILLRPTMSLGLYIQQVGRALRLSEGKTNAIILDHVGNTLIHGMPDAVREWSLVGEKRTKKSISEAGIRVIQCASCYAMFEPNPENKCTECGELQKIDVRKIEQVDGELVKLSDEEIAVKKRTMQIEVAKSQTLEELLKIEKERGYKRGWAKRMFMIRAEKLLKKQQPEVEPEPELFEPEPEQSYFDQWLQSITDGCEYKTVDTNDFIWVERVSDNWILGQFDKILNQPVELLQAIELDPLDELLID